MARFEPFRGLRYSAAPDLSQLICPPYDVIDAPQREELEGRSPDNAVHVEFPVGDGDPYAKADALATQWRSDGILAPEDSATLYAYRMTPPGGRSTLGFIGALGITDEDGVLPHEQTTPKARSDRLDLLRATRMNTSPIWGLSLSTDLACGWSPEDTTTDMPAAVGRDGDGVLHELWVVPADAAAAICTAASQSPIAVADGHHRFETARQYLSEHPDDPAADRIMALLVALTPGSVDVRPIHRLVHAAAESFDVTVALEPWFEVVKPGEGEIIAVTRTGDIALRALSSTRLAAAHDSDSERLQLALDGLGLTDVTYPHEERAVRAAVAAGSAGIGFILRAVEVDVIAAAARAGERFPPKTTFFWPKPQTGFVFRSLDLEAGG